MAILYSVDVKMTAVIEKLIAVIAPHSCLVCGSENNILCDACALDVFEPIPSLCVYCEKPTIDWRVCDKCRSKTGLSSVWVGAEYKGVVAKIIRLYKFERLRASRQPLAKALSNALPYIPPETLVIPLPTAPGRVRERGYDQSVLLAKEFAKLRGARFTQLLNRRHSKRQLGADRKTRLAQAATAYGLTKPLLVRGRSIWLIDDICTTGASLDAAAKLLLKAGAAEVNAAVVAWQRLKV